MTSGFLSISLHYRSLVTLVPLTLFAAGIGWRLLHRREKWKNMVIQANSQLEAQRPHPIYWFDDGSVIVKVCSTQVDDQNTAVVFKIHESLLRRHLNVVLKREPQGGHDVPTLTIPVALGVQLQDFTSLLAYLYHDTPMSSETPFHHVAAILRVSSPEQLDIPTVHSLARSYLVAMFPSGPSPFVHPPHLEEALSLTLRYNITSIQKGIYYSLVTTTDFEPSPDATHKENTAPSKITALTPTHISRCRNLMNGIVEHFTPVLFEPPVTPHMACTNLMADRWFPLIVQSAIARDSVCKPLEALEQLKQVDWVMEGLCAACAREKREEWTNEQEEVWEKMDAWLNLT